jgi:hypothetical protein
MAIYSFENNAFNKVCGTNFNNEGILERQHIQSALKAQIGIVAPDCLVLSEEFSDWSESQRRIDLLAVDKNANLVVIEIKRTETGEHMELQAIRYAAMVSTLTFTKACEIFQKYLTSIGSELIAENELLEFLGWDEPREDDFASDVRIVLVSANFSKELTTSIMWLNDRNIDIRCVRLIPYKYEDRIFIDVQQIIPLPEAESYQIKIRIQTEERREARKFSKDFTRYLFNAAEYNKRKLVLAVIKDWIAKNNPNDVTELITAFPQDIHSGGLFVTKADAAAIYQKQGIDRHFLGDEDLIKFPNSTVYAISNQWGKGNIVKFISTATTLGYVIEEKLS